MPGFGSMAGERIQAIVHLLVSSCRCCSRPVETVGSELAAAASNGPGSVLC